MVAIVGWFARRYYHEGKEKTTNLGEVTIGVTGSLACLLAAGINMVAPASASAASVLELGGCEVNGADGTTSCGLPTAIVTNVNCYAIQAEMITMSSGLQSQAYGPLMTGGGTLLKSVATGNFPPVLYRVAFGWPTQTSGSEEVEWSF